MDIPITVELSKCDINPKRAVCRTWCYGITEVWWCPSVAVHILCKICRYLEVQAYNDAASQPLCQWICWINGQGCQRSPDMCQLFWAGSPTGPTSYINMLIDSHLPLLPEFLHQCQLHTTLLQFLLPTDPMWSMCKTAWTSMLTMQSAHMTQFQMIKAHSVLDSLSVWCSANGYAFLQLSYDVSTLLCFTTVYGCGNSGRHLITRRNTVLVPFANWRISCSPRTPAALLLHLQLHELSQVT